MSGRIQSTNSTTDDDAEDHGQYSDAVEELAGLGISREEQTSARLEEQNKISSRIAPSSPSKQTLSTSPSLASDSSPSFTRAQPASSSSPSTQFTAGFIPLPSTHGAAASQSVSDEEASTPKDNSNEAASFQRRPSLPDPSLPSPTPRAHRNIPGATNYFPLVGTSASTARSPPILDDPLPLPPLSPPVTIGRSNSIFPLVKQPSSRPTASNVFPLVKSPSSNSSGAKTSANPFPFAEPPLSPTPSTSTSTSNFPTTQRRPSIAPSTTSSSSGGGRSTGTSRRREPSNGSSIPRSPSTSSNGRAPSVTSTSYTSRSTNYAASVAPSSEGPTSIFATPVGYKPARSLAGLILSKPKEKEREKESKGGSKFSFLSSKKSSSASNGGTGAGVEKGVTAPAHLIAGPQRSTSNRVLDAALTTSQTWAIRRGEQLMAPSSPAFSLSSSAGGGRGGGGGGAFTYRPGHQIRREQEAAAAARGGGNGGNGVGIGAEELARRLEVERDAAVFSPTSKGSVFPMVNKKPN
ncbi:uncharacterized protein JCM6883_006814 [Sporobolomyces salmoneus]|uniref:uncharacterized protein n=1 Tax=Sporobolomyces salmoneus TaxID=183962 RepID=UPI00316C8A7C